MTACRSAHAGLSESKLTGRGFFSRYCRIDVTDIISLGAEKGKYQMHPAKHSVVLADKSYHGEIRVGITFTATQVREPSLSDLAAALNMCFF